ncbi:ABC transporter ATP-binding protein [Hyalangium gracile]|uniref:ABC transporter ATP-binding protein n=1 Tax=Hyalangium gracile TaxID=394092 RepID=UPI001CCA2991|nr:ABC transporter ATP-binding protein [Hyalangium gracile]
MAEPVLQLQGVTKDYGEEVVTRVLRGIDLELRAGEFAALVGPSGSGKSTLLNLIGLLDRPTGGKVLIQGQDTSELDDDGLARMRARTLGFIFQFHHLLGAFSAAENVMMPLLADEGRPTARMRERALALLRDVGLGERADAPPSKLSGGQQQRVAIARALVTSPPLVLADEPTGNLDTGTSAQVFELLRRFNVERGTTFLIVTHDLRLAEQCDRIIEIVDGSIRRDEPVTRGSRPG